MVSETMEASYHDSTGSINDLLKQYESLKAEYEDNERINDDLDERAQALQNEINQLEAEVPAHQEEDSMTPEEYRFLIDNVLLNTSISYKGDVPEMALILFDYMRSDSLVSSETDAPIVAQLFAVINGIIGLSSGSPSRLCYWLGTNLKLYVMVNLNHEAMKCDDHLRDLMNESIEITISSILTSIIDYSTSKTECYLNDFFLTQRTRLTKEKVFSSITQVLSEMQKGYIDVLFIEEYVRLYFRYVDRYLFNQILVNTKVITPEMMAYMRVRTNALKAMIPSTITIGECFLLTENLTKVVQTNLDTISPSVLFSQTSPIIAPTSIMHVINKINPPVFVVKTIRIY